MNRRLLIVGLGLALVVFVLAGREVGLLGLNFHKIDTDASLTLSHHTERNGTPEGPLSFRARILRGERLWLEHTRVILRAPRIEIEGQLDEVTFTGNDWLPFMKNFTLEYSGDLATVAPTEESPIQFAGTIEGSLTMRIRGFCSRREARRLALDGARERVQKALQKLNP
jgi:hypothetical protein